MDRALHGVVAGERRVGERSSVTRIKFAQGEKKARGWNDHVVGHAAISSQAAGLVLRRVLAVVFHSYPAVCANAAAPGAIDDHCIPDGEPARARPQLLDPARVLMAEGEGELELLRGRRRLQHMKVRVAGACAA